MNTSMKELNISEMEKVSGGDVTITDIPDLPLPKPFVVPDPRPFIPIIAAR